MPVTCKCGCGESIRKGRVFVNKEHQLAWMMNGGAKELYALMPDEARVRGRKAAGTLAVESGWLREAGLKGANRSREIAEQFRSQLSQQESEP